MVKLRGHHNHEHEVPAAYQAWFDGSTQPNADAKRRGRSFRWWLGLIAILIPLIALLALGGLIASIYWNARDDQRREAQAIIVLGAAQFNGVPSHVLKARLDEALELYQQGYAPLIVTTGGNQPGDVYTEAETGFNYLTEHGVPASAILQEDQSDNTEENLTGSAAILKPLGITDVLIVSDGFHLKRAKLMAADAGLTAYGVPADPSPVKPWSFLEFKYIIREAGAIVSYKIGG